MKVAASPQAPGAGITHAVVLRAGRILAAGGIKGAYPPFHGVGAVEDMAGHETTVRSHGGRAVMPFRGRGRVLFLDQRDLIDHARPGGNIQHAVVIGVQVIIHSPGETFDQHVRDVVAVFEVEGGGQIRLCPG